MNTIHLFQEDAYQVSCEATVLAMDGSGIILDQTLFYPLGGGQPGDRDGRGRNPAVDLGLLFGSEFAGANRSSGSLPKKAVI